MSEEKMKKKMSVYELIWSMRDNLSDYHNHKEQMAFRALLSYLVGTTALIFTEGGALKTNVILENCCFISEKSLIVFVLILTGIGVFLYVKWQLGNRRHAADMVTACTNLAARWVDKPPKDDDLKPISFYCNRWVHKSSEWPAAIVTEYNKIIGESVFFGTPRPSEWLIYIIMVAWGITALIRIW